VVVCLSDRMKYIPLQNSQTQRGHKMCMYPSTQFRTLSRFLQVKSGLKNWPPERFSWLRRIWYRNKHFENAAQFSRIISKQTTRKMIPRLEAILSARHGNLEKLSVSSSHTPRYTFIYLTGICLWLHYPQAGWPVFANCTLFWGETLLLKITQKDKTLGFFTLN
jgi:hypothetical protein